MTFQNGHKFGNHNNHWKGGKLTKDQYAALSGLVPDSIEAWRFILQNNAQRQSREWWALRAEVAEKVMKRFAPEVIENSVKYEPGQRSAEFLKDAADRISGNGTGTGDGNSEGSVKGAD